MPVFTWEGKNAAGDVRKGKMNAASSEEVEQRLRQQEINVSRVKKAKKKSGFDLGMGGRVPLGSLVVFTRQSATMIDAGLPLVQCLELLGDNEDNKNLKRILGH